MEGIREAITPPLQYMAATPIEKVYPATFLCSVSLNSLSSLSSVCQAALATIHYKGMVNRNVQRLKCKKITKGIYSMTSLPPWKISL